MTKPLKRSRMAALVFVATMAVVAGGWFVLPQAAFGVVVALGVVVAVGSIGIGLAHGEAEKAFEKVQTGEGLIGRWTLSLEQWQAFLQERSMLEKASTVRAAPLHTPRAVPAAGVEVLVATRAIYVGGEYTPVLPQCASEPRMHKACIEFAVDDPEGGRYVLRIPLAPHARKEAEAVIQRFEAIRLASESQA